MAGERALGRCLCGGVRFEVHGELREVLNCHCHRCRRFTGHHMAATACAPDDLHVRDPGSLLTWFPSDTPDPATGAVWAYGFCRRCGSSLFWRGDGSHVSICAGVLDPPTGLHTASAWWVSEASDYHPRPDVPELERE